ncbi:hypothetical protein PanWU01x14_324580 [Parasponia andersonii]|uniref:Uncharacterized protein n=1 Tax=Parasponia andersonii TaxID=3476 RepID=A0A2P5AK32_PARAD|nr:hypothetical protein PanWU01x14_324580 [Parasponia andersonii]
MVANFSGGSAVALLLSSHALGTGVPELRQNNGAGPSYAQNLSSFPRVKYHVNTCMALPPFKIVIPHASIITLELSKPCIKGNYVCVQVNEQVLRKCMELCQSLFIGHIFLSRSETPWKLTDL